MIGKVLLYCPHVEGHKLEYIHHLYHGARIERETSFIVVTSEKFLSVSSLYEWAPAPNVEFDYIPEIGNENLFHGSGIKKAWFLNKSLLVYIRKHRAERVILIDIIPYLPFLCCQKTKVSGIIYHLFFYSWRNENWRRRVIDYCRQRMLAKAKCIERIFVLNDEFGADFFNRRFNTNKYTYLADPVPNKGQTEDGFLLRKEYSIPKDCIIMLHAGGMMRYKGTLNVLQAIELLDNDDRGRFCFIFAGRVTDEIREKFCELYGRIKDSTNSIIIEGYIAPDRLNALFSQSDYILIPYYPRSQSSGIIGISAMFNKPVITTGQGVVGRLVEKYGLGVVLEDNSPEEIKECLHKIKEARAINGSDYVNSHSVSDFQRVIFSVIKN